MTYDLLHGQWHLDEQGTEPQYPFGWGLGYTEIVIDSAARRGGDVAVTVRNTGDRPGSTVVQVYGSVPTSAHRRPPKRLVGFRKVKDVPPGATKTVSITPDVRQLDLRLDRHLGHRGRARAPLGRAQRRRVDSGVRHLNQLCSGEGVQVTVIRPLPDPVVPMTAAV